MTDRSTNRHSLPARRLLHALLTMLALAAGIVAPTPAFATWPTTGCFKITALTANLNSPYYTEPGTIAKRWAGAADVAGKNAYPMTVQITNFYPNGTLIGSGVASSNDLGYEGVGSYSSEQVLFRCSPDSAGAMYEYFSTNGDNTTAGKTEISSKTGITGSYTFPSPDMAFRVTNLTTGQIVSRYWQARPLAGLDTDSQGWFLVKAKNFSQYKVDLYQCKGCGAYLSNNQPIAYVAFMGGATGSVINKGLYPGADHNTNWTGWHDTWVGAVNPQPSLIKRTGQTTCAVLNTTPFVRFPVITAAELERGGSRQMPVKIDIQCEKAFLPSWSGNQPRQTAMGILVRSANAQSAINAGLKTAGTGVRYLLSNGYGVDPSVARGVGVKLSRPDGSVVNFLTNRYTTMGGANDGWEPALDDAIRGGQDDNWVYYSRTLNATFQAFAPGQTAVTLGRYNATAEAVIQIQ
ncbi:fimbrial protein [Burkholderia guangdongensis]|uniref:fimbrial protein n=1 Tax=Burkholderia guangdongensis TaxID=1792500 RepID=UPI0015CE91FE|nr:fimbrial protein [Burkholderia guangdongensis]